MCPECGGSLRKVFAPPAISFKGSGFYATDHGKKSKVSAESRSDGEKKAETKASDGSTKSEGTKDASSKDSKELLRRSPRSRRSPRRRSRRRRDRRSRGDRRDRRVRLLRLPAGHPHGRGGDAVRCAQRADHDRHGGRPNGRVPPPPRHGSPVPPAPGPLSGEPVGAEGARGHAGLRTVRRRIAAQGDPAADVRDQRPGDRLHEVPSRTPSTTARRPRTSRSPTRTAPPSARRSSRPPCRKGSSTATAARWS